MNTITYTKIYDEPPFNKAEIMRYAGAKSDDMQISELADKCIDEIAGKSVYKVCYRNFDVRFCDGYIDLGFAQTDSKDLGKNLNGCESIILFAATVGLEADRMTVKYSKLSPVKALIFQAIGAERIESLCDIFNSEITEQMKKIGKFTRPRFSPGYEDLPLELQKNIFSALDCPRKIGLTLNESLLMSPSKSVTAIIGIGKQAGSCQTHACQACEKEDCAYRRAK